MISYVSMARGTMPIRSPPPPTVEAATSPVVAYTPDATPAPSIVSFAHAGRRVELSAIVDIIKRLYATGVWLESKTIFALLSDRPLDLSVIVRARLLIYLRLFVSVNCTS